ncbi:reverse transcriptase domain-containing protein [Tanacetum coccineum]
MFCFSLNKVPEKLEDPGKFLIPCALQELNRTSALADSGASINLLPHSIYKKLELEALTPTRITLELANRSITHSMGRPFLRTAKALIDLSEETLTLRVGKEELTIRLSGSTTSTLPPSSSSVKTSDNLEKFANELAPLDSLPPENDKDAEIKFYSSFTLTSPKNSEFEAYLERDSIPQGIDLTLPPTLEWLVYLVNSLENEDKVFKPGILVYHTIHDKNLVTLEENLKENISSGTLLVFKEPSFLLPPPEPPDKCLNFEPILVMKNVVDFYQSNVEDVNSFTIIIWNFLPFFTYTKESPLIFSFRSENFVFDLGIVTFHKPVRPEGSYGSNEIGLFMSKEP